MTETVRKNYNVIGDLKDLVIHTGSTGTRMARAKLERGDKPTLSLKITESALKKIEAAGLGNDAAVDVYGFYDKSTFLDRTNKLRTVDFFTVISAGAPRTTRAPAISAEIAF